MALAIVSLVCFASLGHAQEYAFADAGCVLHDGETGIVAAVLDPVSLRLDTGLEVRLAGIVPFADAEETAAAAVAYLEAVTLGKPVTLRYGASERDRYGRATAQVFIAGSDEAWLQADIVAAGFGIVDDLGGDRSCLAALLKPERAARADQRGLWSRRSPINAWADTLRNVDPRYELVEGRVVSIGRTERTVYLNFGDVWSVDFTVTIDAADANAIEAEGGSLDILVGQDVRIRGWLEQWDGPWIRVDHAEQIEVLNQRNGGGSG